MPYKDPNMFSNKKLSDLMAFSTCISEKEKSLSAPSLGNSGVCLFTSALRLPIVSFYMTTRRPVPALLLANSEPCGNSAYRLH